MLIAEARSLHSSDEEPLWKQLNDSNAHPHDLLRVAGITEPPVDVEYIAQRIGVGVQYAQDPGWAGAVSSDGPFATIWVREEDHRTRQRFIIAHELGHLMLHPGTNFRDVSFDGNPQEVEANEFAAELLMPSAFIKHYFELAPDPAELATIFDVSHAAVVVRLDRLMKGRVHY